MKRLGLIIALLFLALSSFGQVKITSGDVNLRTTPEINENKICKIPKGSAVTIIQDSVTLENWTKVNYKGRVGYVSKKLLKDKPAAKSGKPTVIKYYKNSKGNTVQSPTYYNSAPAGATAECNDGTYSFSQNHRGTCSHHGGVKRWLDE